MVAADDRGIKSCWFHAVQCRCCAQPHNSQVTQQAQARPRWSLVV